MPSCHRPYIADDNVQEQDAGEEGFLIVKHVVKKVDIIFSYFHMTSLLRNYIVRHHIDNEMMTSVEDTRNHGLFP